MDFDADGNLVVNGMAGLDAFVPDSVVLIDPSGALVRRVRTPWVLATVTPDGGTLLLDDFETGRLQALSLRGR